MNSPPRVPLLIAVLLLAACAGPGTYVWADDLHMPSDPVTAGRGYVLRAGDVISVRVFNQEQMSAKERVREDGKVSLPFLNDVTAAGYTPQELGVQLQTRLKDFINAPVVTVAVEEERGVPVAVAGEVLKPGVYALEHGAGVLQALVQAGGLTEYAGKDRIYVLRRQLPGRPVLRIRFVYRALLRGEGESGLFQLRPGDTVVVE